MPRRRRWGPRGLRQRVDLTFEAADDGLDGHNLDDFVLAAWWGPIFQVVAKSPPEIAAVGPREVQACVGDGGLAKSS